MSREKYRYKVQIALMVMCSVLAISFSAEAATYYVSNNGNDSPYVPNDGNDSEPGSAMLPYATIGKVQSVVRPGDTVFFDSAGTWAASSGSSVLTPKAGVTYIGDSWGNGTRATLLASGKLSRAVIYFDNDDQNNETAVQGFHVDGNGKLVDLISICHNGSVDSDLTGATKRIQNCVAHDTGAGNYYYGIIIAPNRGNIVANVKIVDNEVYRTAWSAITAYPYYKGDTNTVRNVLIRNNYVHDTLGPQGSHGIMVCGDNVDDVTIEYNYIKNIYDYGLEFASKTAKGINNIVARNNIVVGCKRMVDFWAQSPGNNFDVTLYGNIFMNNRDSMRFSSSVDGLNIALRVYNNIFYKNGGTAEIYMDRNPNFSVFEVKNNIFYSSNPSYYDSSSRNQITSHSNNIYYRSSGTLVRTGGSNYDGASLKSYESTAISAAPGFNNQNSLPTRFIKLNDDRVKPNTDGLSIISGGAINGGINLGGSYNESINSVLRPQSGPWDIGAYQGQSDDSNNFAVPTNLRIVAIQ